MRALSLQRLSHARRLSALALLAWLLMAAMPVVAGVAAPVMSMAAQGHGHAQMQVAQDHHAAAMPCCDDAGNGTGAAHACGCTLACASALLLPQRAFAWLPLSMAQEWPAMAPTWAGPPTHPPRRPPRV